LRLAALDERCELGNFTPTLLVAASSEATRTTGQRERCGAFTDSLGRLLVDRGSCNVVMAEMR